MARLLIDWHGNNYWFSSTSIVNFQSFYEHIGPVIQHPEMSEVSSRWPSSLGIDRVWPFSLTSYNTVEAAYDFGLAYAARDYK